MFGDCQVLSNIGSGGNGAIHPSDSFFSSQMPNPNYSFMPNLPFTVFPPHISPKEEIYQTLKRGKEEMESGSGGSEQIEGGLSGNEQDTVQQPPAKKKRYHRHTAHQIQEMESLFKECPHPDDKQRMKLSQDLGLKPRQVKFWFQNRRTQMKAQQDRADNAVLRAENDNLRSENYRLQATLRNIMCPSCGGPAVLGDMSFDAHQLRIENARLKEELERVCTIGSRYGGRSMQAIGAAAGAPPLLPPTVDLDMSFYPRPLIEDSLSNCTTMISLPPLMPENSSHFSGGGGLLIMDQEKPLAMELALSCVDELMKMCEAVEPLWIQNASGREELNIEEYKKMFSWPPMNLRQLPSEPLRTEASRDTEVVIMNSITLVDAFLDADKWVEMFPSIISRARTLQIVSSGVGSGNANGSLHLMYAEMQVLSPLVPTREAHFLRYCHQNVEEGTWAIVDFPLDSLQDNYPLSFPIYKRRPSGCIIQDMPNGYSRVTWVEHAEVEDRPVHQIFEQFVNSGMAFGAQRWLAVLRRQCERLASLMARNISDLGVIPSPEARTNLMNLAQRMIRTFCVSLSSSSGQSWTALSDCPEDTIRITTRKATEPGHPNGLILSAVSTTWLPYSHFRVFDLLRDECRRAQMDVLSNGNSLHEVAHIANGSHPGNCISLLRINVASNSSQTVEFMLQESCTDETGSLVAYTTVDVDAVQLAMNGEDPSCIPILPIGFVIIPMSESTSNSSTKSIQDSGCLLTIGLQVLASTLPNAKLNLSSVTAINNHICNTIHQINTALSGSSTSGCHDSGDLIASGSSADPPSAPPLQQKDESVSTSC